MDIFDKLSDSPEIDSVVSEAIIRRAQEQPMDLVYIGAAGGLAIGNTGSGFRYLDRDGNSLPGALAEPFRLEGMDVVIRRGLLITGSGSSY